MQYVSTNKKYIGDLSTQVVEIYWQTELLEVAVGEAGYKIP
jgi:acyl-coenzyme A synthetase/AMP-(fatty) acid ligase